MASFELQVKGLDKVVAILNDLPQKTQFAIQDEFKATGLEWVAAAQRDAPADRGRLRASVNKNDGYLTLEIGAQTAYAAYQEFGTGGKFRAPVVLGSYPSQFQGAGQSGTNPIEALTAWVKRKGLAQRYTIPLAKKNFGNKKRNGGRKTKQDFARGIAIAIFKKQRKEGMRPQPFLFSGKDGSDRVTFYLNQLRTNIANKLKELV